ncbi:MAG: hypothetical protein GXN93_02855 [Candidatus Diapherotrites archaeon]|nr:hypothetical protein [Candidatus Diapherotrites archaeon]
MAEVDDGATMQIILDRLNRIERKLDLLAERLEEFSEEDLEDIRRDVRGAIIAYHEGKDEFVSVDEI